MLRLLNDQGDESGTFLTEATRTSLTAALLEHRAALVVLASSVCDFARDLQAHGAGREEIVIAVREVVAESRTTTNVLEETGDDEVLDAMVDSCLDEFVARQ